MSGRKHEVKQYLASLALTRLLTQTNKKWFEMTFEELKQMLTPDYESISKHGLCDEKLIGEGTNGAVQLSTEVYTISDSKQASRKKTRRPSAGGCKRGRGTLATPGMAGHRKRVGSRMKRVRLSPVHCFLWVVRVESNSMNSGSLQEPRNMQCRIHRERRKCWQSIAGISKSEFAANRIQ